MRKFRNAIGTVHIALMRGKNQFSPALRISLNFLVLLFAILTRSQAKTAETASNQRPSIPCARIDFATPTFVFHRASPGDSIKYSFTFTNTGNAPLIISAVRSDCGCTTANDWTRRVEPGKTGAIPVQLDVADNWPSGPVNKTVTVDSNDPANPAIVLQIRGDIWKPVDFTPMLASFNLIADAPAASTAIHIVNNTDSPLTLSSLQMNHPNFRTLLQTNRPGKEFELVITAQPPFTPGSLQAEIKLKTSAGAQPEIRVPVYATIQPIITVMPPQIVFRPRAPGMGYSPKITIQNNSTNSLKLSHPIINVRNVSVQIIEANPGQVFVATLNFPANFVFPSGNPLELKVTTSFPHFPEIKVPIKAMPPSAR
jgi:hypothetical protein